MAREIQRQGLPVRLLALSTQQTDAYIQEMLKAGCLLRSEAPETIVAAARRLSLWTAEQLTRVHHWREGVQELWESLTEKERDVLGLVVKGLSNKEIAKALDVTERTVEFHVSNILGKLGLSSRLEVAVWAKKHKLCE